MGFGRTWWLVAMLAGGIGCGKPVTEVVTVGPGPTLVGKPAASLAGALTWLNSPELTLGGLRGQVVVLQFFDYNCVNCIRTYPYLLEWQRRYAPFGLRMIGIHSPQYEFSTDPKHVYADVKRYNLTYPIAVDSYLKIADAYGNRFWPRTLVIDQAGIIRSDQIGEGGYAQTEATIQRLLRAANPAVKWPDIFPAVHDFDRPGAICYPTTPELYLGRVRGQLGNPEKAGTNASTTYQLPDTRVEGKVYAEGDWAVSDEYMRHAADKETLGDSLTLKYRGTELNVVMKPEGIYWHQVYVEIDGKPVAREVAGADIAYEPTGLSVVKVDAPRMYNITNKQPYGTHEARFSMRGMGLSVYSFSFGTCAIPTDAATLRSSEGPP